MRHDPWLGIRVGEARHPGPHGSRVTARKRYQRDLGGAQLLHDPNRGRRIGEASHPGPKKQELNLGGFDLGALLQPFIQQIVTSLLQKLMKEFDLGSLVSNLGGKAKAFKPKKPKKPKRHSASSGNRVVTESAPPDAPTSPKDVGKGKGKGKGKDAVNDKSKGKGKGKASTSEDTSTDEGWTVIQRKGKAESKPWTLRADDWDSPLINFGDLGGELDKPEVKEIKAVIQCEAGRVDTLRSMLQGSGKPFAVLVIVPGKGDGSSRIPGLIGEKLHFQEAISWKFQSDDQAVSVPQPKGMKQVATKFVKKPTCVLRVQFAEAFLEESRWSEIAKAPQRAFHLWLTDRKLKAVDSWGWMRETGFHAKEQIHSLVRVLESDVEPLLAYSGDEAFVSPTLTCKVKPFQIQWFEMKTDEDKLAWLARARRHESELGVIAGNRQLGLRITRNPADPISRVWLIEHVPHDWTQDDVCTALQDQFTDVQLIRQRRTRHGFDYWFKGCSPLNHDVVALPIETNEGRGLITLSARWTPPRGTPQKGHLVKPVRTLNLRSPPTPLSTAVTAVPKETEATVDEAGKEASANKRAKAVCRDIPKGLTRKIVPGDGACLFHAVGAGLQQIHGKSPHARELRASVVDHLTKHESKYTPFWNGKCPDGAKLDSWADYLTKMKKADAWGGDLEMSALARMYDVRIICIPQPLDFEPISYHSSSKDSIVLWWTGNHFDLLTCTGPLPEEIAAINKSPAKPVGMRGGSISKMSDGRCTVFTEDANPSLVTNDVNPSHKTTWTAVPSRRTVWSDAQVPSRCTVWTHDKVALRIHGKTSPHQVTFGPNSSCDVTTVAPTIAADLAELDDMMPEPAAKRRIASCSQVLQADGSYRWCCPLCPFVLITHKDGKHFSGAKIGHVRNHHPNEKAATYLKKFKHRVTGQDVSGLPEEAIAWKCVFCPFGITRAECGNATKSPIANFGLRHRRECHPEISLQDWRRRRVQQTYERNAVLRHRTRVRLLNASAAKVKPPPGHNCLPFTLPVVFANNKRGGERNLHYLRAWACRDCLFCFYKRWPKYALECKGPDAFKNRRTSAPKILAQHRAEKEELSTGIPRHEMEAHFDEAEKFLSGVFPPLPS